MQVYLYIWYYSLRVNIILRSGIIRQWHSSFNLSVPIYTQWWFRLIEKDPNAGKDWGQEEKGATEDKMVVWHHQLSGHKVEQTQGESEGQGNLGMLQSSHVSESQTWLSDWTIITKEHPYASLFVHLIDCTNIYS